MGIFDRIRDAILGGPAAASDQSASRPTATDAPVSPGAAPAPTSSSEAPTGATSAPMSAATQPDQPLQLMRDVDIAANLDAAAAKSGQKLDWRHSIVDLMKALGMDASLTERRELAEELAYTGDTHDTAKMNMYLHKALMQKLAENGGKVPQSLLD
ncbi:DUF3597 domain-containing protein [Frigidibacter sp. MR17.14]|uniref:DUF3597 domain-containing protein n=1 Tax=Frigidibacter sp. MR17.14 TaxID=3126509 RepID=UPI00301319BC